MWAVQPALAAARNRESWMRSRQFDEDKTYPAVLVSGTQLLIMLSLLLTWKPAATAPKARLDS